MAGTCVRHTELPHTSKLFADYVYHFDRVARFYTLPPHALDSYRAAAAQAGMDEARRAALIAALRSQNGDHPALIELAKPGVCAVVTGQQVGLFSGPSYTIYKALSAVLLAARLTQAGIPSVPVFWLATEDHDLDEVNHCWVFNAAQQPVRLEMTANGGGRTPVGQIVPARFPVDELRTALRDLPFGDDVSTLVAGCYQPGRTMGAAFGALLQRLMPQLVLFDPMHPASRELAAPLLSRAVEHMPDLLRRVLARNAELAEAGYHAQVHVEEQTSLVFLLENGKRLALRRNGSEYHADARRFSAEELAAHGERLSPNALLRPVVQDSMLPTVAYVGGPAELAYLAQSGVIYEQLLGRMPVAVPRQGATLLDARAAKLFARYQLTLRDFFEAEEGVAGRIAAQLVPPELQAAFEHGRAKVGAELDALAGALSPFDASLAEAFARSRRKMEYQLAKMERKTTRAALQRTDRAQSEAQYLASLVYPNKHLQERLYSILPFLAKHGLDLPDRLAQALTPDCLDHRVLPV